MQHSLESDQLKYKLLKTDLIRGGSTLATVAHDESGGLDTAEGDGESEFTVRQRKFSENFSILDANQANHEINKVALGIFRKDLEKSQALEKQLSKQLQTLKDKGVLESSNEIKTLNTQLFDLDTLIYQQEDIVANTEYQVAADELLITTNRLLTVIGYSNLLMERGSRAPTGKSEPILVPKIGIISQVINAIEGCAAGAVTGLVTDGPVGAAVGCVLGGAFAANEESFLGRLASGVLAGIGLGPVRTIGEALLKKLGADAAATAVKIEEQIISREQVTFVKSAENFTHTTGTVAGEMIARPTVGYDSKTFFNAIYTPERWTIKQAFRPGKIKTFRARDVVAYQYREASLAAKTPFYGTLPKEIVFDKVVNFKTQKAIKGLQSGSKELKEALTKTEIGGFAKALGEEYGLEITEVLSDYSQSVSGISPNLTFKFRKAADGVIGGKAKAVEEAAAAVTTAV